VDAIDSSIDDNMGGYICVQFLDHFSKQASASFPDTDRDPNSQTAITMDSIPFQQPTIAAISAFTPIIFGRNNIYGNEK
jgi:hypothetical protein